LFVVVLPDIYIEVFVLFFIVNVGMLKRLRFLGGECWGVGKIFQIRKDGDEKKRD
jgi:hypothetical protein